jgi:hypothetical protein
MQAMKKMFKTLLPGALALAFFAAPAVIPTVSAQDPAAAAAANPEKTELDDKFRKNRTTNKEVAYQASKDYLAKFSNDTDNQDFVKYLQGWNKKYEDSLKEAADAAIAERCVNAIKAKNNAEVFSGCQTWAAKEPNNASPVLAPIDVGFVLATSSPAVNTYNDQTIALAKQAIQKIESNGFGDVKWAAYNYKSKEDALAWMNYIIGFITFNNLTGKEADAVPYLYKSLQYTSEIKNKPLPYYAIGFNYRTQYNKAVQDFQTKYQGATEVTDAMKQDLGMQKALADRAIDAFARAYAVAKADTKLPQAARDARLKDLEQMYKIRNKEQTAGMNELVASVMTKPLPDPSSPVTPVIEVTTTTAATTAAATETKSPASTTANGDAGTRPRTTGTAAAPAAGATTTAKPAATKPAPKKPSR